jgi:hypothetical protein
VEKTPDGKYYPGFALQLPIKVPVLPYPYGPNDTAEDRANYQAKNPGGDLEMQQLICNQEAIITGNKTAEDEIREYNNAVCQFWDNGGPANTFGYKLPKPLDVTHCYPPATDATPGGGKIRVWSLPAGAVLFEIPTPLAPAIA